MSEDSKNKIMEATYKALCKHGYADLSVQNIADEFDKGKSLIYYHYDNKEELMLAFLDFMGEHVRKNHNELDGVAPEKRLDKLLDMTLGVEDDEMWEFHRAFLELRAQVPKSLEFVESFEEIDDLISENIREILDELNVDEPEIMAEILVSAIEGSVIRKVSTDDREGLKELKTNIKDIVEQHITNGSVN